MKYHNGSSMICGHCNGKIIAWKVVVNPQHIYQVGQKFECLDCGVSGLWTNSIRNTEQFVAFLTGQAPDYRRGFCNDQFCIYCAGYVQPLKNGYQYKGKVYDRYGCPKCDKNQMIMVDAHLKNGEGDTSWIMQWYKRHQADVERALKQGY